MNGAYIVAAIEDLADLGYGPELWRNDEGWGVALWNTGVPYSRNPAWMRANDGMGLSAALADAVSWARSHSRSAPAHSQKPETP